MLAAATGKDSILIGIWVGLGQHGGLAFIRMADSIPPTGGGSPTRRHGPPYMVP